MKIVFYLLALISAPAWCQTSVALYDGPVPNSVPNDVKEVLGEGGGGIKYVKDVAVPSMAVYLPTDAQVPSPAVIIFPGGGYAVEAYEAEGNLIAEKFKKEGVAAFVVRYRLPSDQTMKDKSIGPLQDAQQAIRLVRLNAARYHVDGHHVGVMGFSAGGHVASTAGTHYKTVLIDDPEGTSVRPDFMILIYPVISMTDSLGHRGSRNNLLGPNPSPELIREFSNEMQVTDDTPPTILMQTGDDRTVDVDNSIAFYEALRHHNVPAEMHLFPHGDHGFILHLSPDDWMDPVVAWARKESW